VQPEFGGGMVVGHVAKAGGTPLPIRSAASELDASNCGRRGLNHHVPGTLPIPTRLHRHRRYRRQHLSPFRNTEPDDTVIPRQSVPKFRRAVWAGFRRPVTKISRTGCAVAYRPKALCLPRNSRRFGPLGDASQRA
jgi:hypothetical protein